MTTLTQKATVSPVPFGKSLVIDGLLLADGNFAIAVPQICSLFQFGKSNASRDIKATLGAGFLFLKTQTALSPKAVNAIALKDFEQLVFILAQKGYATALRLWNKAHPEESQLNYVKPIALSKLPKPGFIYLLEGSNCLKLGYSTNVEQRLKTLNRWIDELELVATVKATIGKEKALHSALHKTGDCLGEEWYPVYRKHEILGLMDVTLSDDAVAIARVRRAKIDFKD